jgi:dipeptidyl aminopeptidase/acylaminoacyl peptidase
MRARAFLLTLALAAGAVTAAAATRPVALDDFSRVQDVRDPHVSPDGEWVLYTVSVADPQADRNRTDIWKVKWDGSQQTRVTFGSDSPSAPRWSPDGKYISFLSSRGGEARGSQVWVMDRSGGEPRQLTQLKGRIASYEWSPDSTRLLLVYRDADGSDPEPARGDNARPPAPKPMVINKYQFKRDVQGYLTGNARSRVYVYDIATHALEMLTADGDYEESNPAWSPDGRRVAFVSNHDKNWERTRNNDVFVVDARPGSKSRPLTTWQGTDGGALAWSPDGALIVYGQGSEPKYDFHNMSRLAVVPSAGGTPRLLTPALDRGTSSPSVSDDGKFVVFEVADDRTTYLARVPVGGGAVERLITGPRTVGQISRVGTHIAAMMSTDTTPGEVFAVEGGAPRKLTTHNDAVVGELALIPAEDISFPSKDGADIHALLTKPSGYVAGRRYPTLVRIHGGPTGQDAHSFQFERQLFAAHGYVVVNINYRGSSGRGAKFSEAIQTNWGHLEVDDVLAGVDYLVKQGIADPDRLGIGGWSYGGVLTDYVIASDTRFKAAISGAGSANHISLYGHDQYVFLYDNEYGAPWKNPQLWLEFSYPFFKADRIKTPTLFMGGQNDFNVPIIGGEQMYQALTTLGVATELVVYPGQNHGFTRTSFIRDRYERYLAWYDKYLKGPASTNGAGAARH